MKYIDSLLDIDIEKEGLPTTPKIVRGSGLGYNRILDINTVEDYLCISGARLPFVGLTSIEKSYNQFRDVPFQLRETGYFDPEIVMKEYIDGSTIIIKHADHVIPSLNSLKNRVQEEIYPFTVQTNVYLAPWDTQGVSPHADPHDTLLIQCSGSKRWLVWGRIFDDSSESLIESKSYSQMVKDEVEKAPIVEEVINEGDVLFLPKGYVHTPFTSDVHSLHMTLGLQKHSVKGHIRMSSNISSEIPFSDQDNVRQYVEVV